MEEKIKEIVQTQIQQEKLIQQVIEKYENDKKLYENDKKLNKLEHDYLLFKYNEAIQ